jgi:hypothetical protein
MNKLYIFDLDGTLCNIDHRRPILDDTSNSHRWDDFYEACDKDTPNQAVISTLHALWAADQDIWFFSGRSESVRRKTTVWLWSNTYLMPSWFHLMMRPIGDSRPDDVLKQEFLDNMLLEDRQRLVAVFDDRDKVVAMWRRNGVACFQVAPGNF